METTASITYNLIKLDIERERQELTYQALADRVGSQRDIVWRVLRRKRKSASYQQALPLIKKLADALGVSMDDIRIYPKDQQKPEAA